MHPVFLVHPVVYYQYEASWPSMAQETGMMCVLREIFCSVVIEGACVSITPHGWAYMPKMTFPEIIKSLSFQYVSLRVICSVPIMLVAMLIQVLNHVDVMMLATIY